MLCELLGPVQYVKSSSDRGGGPLGRRDSASELDGLPRRGDGISEQANEMKLNSERWRGNANDLHKPFLHRSGFPGGGAWDLAPHTMVHEVTPLNEPNTGVLRSGLSFAIGFSLEENGIPFRLCRLSWLREK
jgi:hypothetical protein